MTDLGTLNGGYSSGYGINASGQVVGQSDGRAFLYTDGKMVDLNALLAHDPTGPLALYTYLTEARAINDLGWIVANGYDGSGALHAYLLTPIPLPGTLWLLISGIVVAATPQRRIGGLRVERRSGGPH